MGKGREIRTVNSVYGTRTRLPGQAAAAHGERGSAGKEAWGPLLGGEGR